MRQGVLIPVVSGTSQRTKGGAEAPLSFSGCGGGLIGPDSSGVESSDRGSHYDSVDRSETPGTG